ncbi:MAG TPA: RluA family pseudouridine synthase [Candidatus Flavonifractor intestinipullorum]|uniref:Pseudouridine synthase n=1 Tax=Candidatus Flavonifractor intestinipullorum TaxID=2838587 RepID=A0A9D2MBJ1_9FIRM|nr:RluA family pseudouridine synthase [Candidatus Flavonifractor intestinipullorum]
MQETNRRPDLVWTAEADDSLLAFLLRHVKGKSRNNIKSMLARGQVSVDGRTATRFDHPVAVGSRVAVKAHVEEEVPGLPFPILYEDRDILVIDKPAGLLTIANEKEKVRTAYHMLTDYVRQESKFGRVFVVHRLDRDTSGVVLFAKNEETKRAFQEDWDARVLRRGYRALVEGVPQPPEGEVRSFLRETRTHLVYSGAPGRDAKEAVTLYRTLASGGGYALLEIDLKTGRKNQIRVHMSDLGHPIAGDRQYGARTRPLGRLCLHAHRLELIDPRSGEKRVFAAREPAAFRRLCRGGARS